jgi:multiple sugar transport system substrate-binding protein
VFDSPENRQALEFYLGLRRSGVMEKQDQLDRMFKAGTLGLDLSGAWLLKSIPKEAPSLRYGLALVPCPARDRGTHASFAGGEVLVGFRASKHPKPALELARFLAQPEVAQRLAAAVMSVQPAAVGADTLAYYRSRPEQQMMIRQFETAYFTPNHPQWDDMEAAIEDAVEKALYDKETAPQAIAEAQQRLAELVGKR